MTPLELHIKATQFRIQILKTIHKANAGYIGGSLSCLDILVALYYGDISGERFMKYDAAKPGWDGQDYFVISKGHAAVSLYVILADLGFFPIEELDHFSQMHALLQPWSSRKIPGIAVTTGSLGHGISLAVGLAMCLKMEKVPNRVYVLLGDGELQEGQVWEAIMAASHYKLDNLIAIVDKNALQTDGYVRSVMNVDPLAEKFSAFGWYPLMVRDGHDFQELIAAFDKVREVQRKPAVLIAHTVKSKGVTFAENNILYQTVPFSQEEMNVAVPSLEALLNNLRKL